MTNGKFFECSFRRQQKNHSSKKAKILCIFDAKLIKDEKRFFTDVIACDPYVDNFRLFLL